jgi:anti-sigma28 factor (negative regulator of flagellin synthesis)
MDKTDRRGPKSHEPAFEPTGPKKPRAATLGPKPADPDQEKARLMQKAREIIDQTPEVRPDRVAVLGEAVRQGTYRVDTRRLANILIVKLFTER